MRLTKQQSKILSIAILVVFFGGSILFVRSPQPDTISLNTDELESTPTNSSPDQAEVKEPSELSLRDFHRSETRDGKVIWEVRGQNAKFFPKENSVKITRGDLTFTTDDNKPVRVQGGEALLLLDGPSLMKAELSQQVTLLFNEEITIRSETADYDPVKESVVIPGDVKIESALLEISGKQLETDLKSQVTHISRNVESMIKPRRKSAK